MRYILLVLLWLLLGAAQAPAADLRVDTEAAEAVLDMLDQQAAGRQIGAAQWDRLLASAGYRRLKVREAVMGRAFTDAEFRTFVSGADLIARRSALRETLERWRSADIRDARARAAAYLPAGTRIRATIFPMIKPRANSFVFDIGGDPAIFLYLDPDVSRARFANTAAHELHHIGLAAACSGQARSDLTPVGLAITTWSSAFGEGVAMLAAAGGPEEHPHAVSSAEERARWDRDVANYEADFARLTTFFVDIREGRLAGDALQQQAMSFFGVQGPWYTVGWRMAQLIEQQFGRPALIDVLCDRHAFFVAYNRAAARTSSPVWPQSILDALAGH